MAKCPYCERETGPTGARRTIKGTSVIIITCGLCRKILGAVSDATSIVNDISLLLKK